MVYLEKQTQKTKLSAFLSVSISLIAQTQLTFSYKETYVITSSETGDLKIKIKMQSSSKLGQEKCSVLG